MLDDMSEQPTPSPEPTVLDVVETIASTCEDLAKGHEKRANDSRHPGSYREADAEDLATAAAHDAVSDAMSDLAAALREKFGLTPSWAQPR